MIDPHRFRSLWSPYWNLWYFIRSLSHQLRHQVCLSIGHGKHIRCSWALKFMRAHIFSLTIHRWTVSWDEHKAFVRWLSIFSELVTFYAPRCCSFHYIEVGRPANRWHCRWIALIKALGRKIRQVTQFVLSVVGRKLTGEDVLWHHLSWRLWLDARGVESNALDF